MTNEIEWLKSIFTSVLPTNPDNTEGITNYFNKLQEVISTIDDVSVVRREAFPSDLSPEDGRASDYKYFSAAETKKRSCGQAHLTNKQDVDHPSIHDESRSSVQDLNSEHENFQRISEHSQTEESSPPEHDSWLQRGV